MIKENWYLKKLLRTWLNSESGVTNAKRTFAPVVTTNHITSVRLAIKMMLALVDSVTMSSNSHHPV